MRKLIVTLPQNRDIEGTVHVEEDSRLLAGPFPVCGRADGTAAERHGNPSRNPLLPFGDTPLGLYRIVGLLRSGFGTALPRKLFGPHNVLVLQPVGGDAALADANGRFHTLIQGGKEGPDKRLLPTNGSLRLRDKDQKKLLRALGKKGITGFECEVRTGEVKGKPVAQNLPYELGDPLTGDAREALRKLVVTSVFVIGTSLSLIHSLTPSVFKYATIAYKGYLLEEAQRVSGKTRTNTFGPPPGGGTFLMAGGGNGDGYQGPESWVPAPGTKSYDQLVQTEDSGIQAVNSISDEEAKEHSNEGFDTAGPNKGVVDLRTIAPEPGNPQQEWTNDDSPVSPTSLNSFGHSSDTPVQVTEPSEPVGPAEPAPDKNAVAVPWDSNQKELPSVPLFSPPAPQSKYNPDSAPPPPALSQEQVDALVRERKLQEDYDNRSQWLKDLDNASANAVNQMSNSVSPETRKAIINATPMHEVIADSFNMGGKIFDAQRGDPEAKKTLWTQDGAALVLDMTKEVATHSIGDEVTTGLDSTYGATVLKENVGEWATKKVTEKAGDTVADTYWETTSENVKKIVNNLNPGTFPMEEDVKHEKALNGWFENFPSFKNLKNKLTGKNDSEGEQ